MKDVDIIDINSDNLDLGFEGKLFFMVNPQKEKGQISQSIPIRRPKIDFEKMGGSYYLKGNAFVSHFITAFNFLFPSGEQFFVDSVMAFKDQVQDPKLCSDIKNFCGQELQHKNQHTLFIQMLQNQGYESKGWMKFLKWYFGTFIRSLPSGFRLGHTAGCEHITAAFAHAALKNHMLDGADPAMRQLLVWHAIEEMEHKHVAFDVFKTVRPKGYLLRAFSFVTGVFGWLALSCFGWAKIFKEDFQKHRLSFIEFKADFIWLITDKGIWTFWKDFYITLAKYLKPGFHPKQIDDQYLLDLYYPEVQQFS